MGCTSVGENQWAVKASTWGSTTVGTNSDDSSFDNEFGPPLGEEWSDHCDHWNQGKQWPNQIIGPYMPIQPPLKDPSDMSDLQDLLRQIGEQSQTLKEDEVKSLKDEVKKLAGQLKKLRTEFNKLKKQLRPPPKPGQRQLEL